MSQLLAYSTSGFLFSYTHNTCRSIEPTSFEFLVSMCSYIAWIYNASLVHLRFPSRTGGYVLFFCFSFWTPVNDVSFCEMWGAGFRYLWVVPMSSVVTESPRFEGTYLVHLRLRRNPRILENGRHRIWKLHINGLLLLLFERRTKYPTI
jgi:hypothetical protein